MVTGALACGAGTPVARNSPTMGQRVERGGGENGLSPILRL